MFLSCSFFFFPAGLRKFCWRSSFLQVSPLIHNTD